MPPCTRKTAPAKGRHFGKLEMLDFLEQTSEAHNIVTVHSADLDAPPQACHQILDKTCRNVLVPTFKSKRKNLGHRWMVRPLEMWRSHEVNAVDIFWSGDQAEAELQALERYAQRLRWHD